MPIQTKFVSWQLEHPPVIPEWICAEVGIGVANNVPGAVFVADAAINPAGVDPKWHASQLLLDGMCEFAPAGEVGGSTTILLTPAKLLPVMVGP
jgi:hypothetical protein